jgi:hypothetical protein
VATAAEHNVRVTRTRTGLLIIRAWLEPGSSSPLRIHIRLTTDVTQGFESSVTVVQEEATIQAVQAWLSDISASTRNVTSDSDSP